ncbi:MAG: DNA polymerase III subunit gamma/tau, partial [Clostridia bacterium]|nr:DNA polymerase III subunit gamma/tau [Clostridia bacterium]
MASYTSLYRKYRPDSFDKMLGQKHIIKTLSNAVLAGKISHAYLFTGTRGTGKTSTAKIFAKAINCLSPLSDGSPCGVCEVCKALASPNN